MSTVRTLFVLLFVALSASALAGEPATVPLGGGPEGIDGWRVVPLPCVEATLARADRADGEKPALAIAFRKKGEPRRLLALEAPFRGLAAAPKSLSVSYRLKLAEGRPPLLALVLYEKGGGVWFKVGAAPLAAGTAFAEVRLPLTAFRQAAFGTSSEKEPKWENVEKVWLGLVMDGPADGLFELSRAVLTSEPFHATRPLPLAAEASRWDIGKDPAAQATLAQVAEGPDGKPCLKTEFSFPGRSHTYITPTCPVGDIELEGYTGLRFAYKATLPPGIAGLLVCLNERGGAQYYADPAPPASDEWKTATLPFASFKLGTWTKDEDNRLDLDQIASVIIGLHGTASAESARGAIWAAEIEFVP